MNLFDLVNCFMGSFLIPIEDWEYLDLLSLTEWQAGREVRKRMVRKKKRLIGLAKFYKAMANLEDLGLIEHRHTTEKIGVSPYREIQYRLLENGITVLEEKTLRSSTGYLPAHLINKARAGFFMPQFLP
jgi:hypothetical protein